MEDTKINTDGMSRETALALLTDPKLKMTATFRKECKRALDRPAYSLRTILKSGEGYTYDMSRKPRHPMERLEAKCRDLSIGVLRLAKWCSRAARRARHALGMASRADSIAAKTQLTDYALAQAEVCAKLQGAVDTRAGLDKV
jgi:endo-1,4-beta-D-glucanase Y